VEIEAKMMLWEELDQRKA